MDIAPRLDSLVRTALNAPDRQTASWKHRITPPLVIALGVWTTYNLLDVGLANLLGLDTLRHATGPFGQIGIRLLGADPSRGGDGSGSTQEFPGAVEEGAVERARGFFYLFKDTHRMAALIHRTLGDNQVIAILKQHIDLHLVTLPSQTLLATQGALKRHFNLTNPQAHAHAARVAWLLSHFLPPIRFHFAPEDLQSIPDDALCMQLKPRVVFPKDANGLCSFTHIPTEDIAAGGYGLENDPDTCTSLNPWKLIESGQGECIPFGYRTRQKIGHAHLGIMGSLCQGVNGQMFNRISNRPIEAAVGAVLLGLSMMTARSMYRYVCHLRHPTAQVAPLSIKDRDIRSGVILNEQQKRILKTLKRIEAISCYMLCWWVNSVL